MIEFNFDPVNGLLDTVVFPTDPEDETAARQQFMRIFFQLGDYLNETINPAIAALSPDPNRIFCDMRGVRFYA